MSAAGESPHVAIIGGGLCGLGLAIALQKHQIPYTIYERQSTFSEIGAGLNIAPNAITTFNLIEPGLGDAVIALATPNPQPDVWMVNRLGAPTKNFPDAHVAARFMSQGVPHISAGRYELLNLLASKIDRSNARFLKKLTSLEQDESGVHLRFEDGSTDHANIAIGCDGIHSTVRQCLLGPDHPSVGPSFTGAAGYRAVFPLEKLTEILGPEIPLTSCVWSGPRGYFIMYLIDGGKSVNVGLWRNKEHLRERLASERWVLKNQKAAMLEDFKDWGESTQKVMNLMSEDTSLWTSHHYAEELPSYFKGAVCLIGDAAHAMTPNWGQGSAQAMEDAYVLAEVLGQVPSLSGKGLTMTQRIGAALSAWQEVRKPQFEWVSRSSFEAFDWWASFWRADLTDDDLVKRGKDGVRELSTIWNTNPDRQGEVAKFVVDRIYRQLRMEAST